MYFCVRTESGRVMCPYEISPTEKYSVKAIHHL
jgi:hypothetical protein